MKLVVRDTEKANCQAAIMAKRRRRRREITASVPGERRINSPHERQNAMGLPAGHAPGTCVMVPLRDFI